MTDMEHSDYFKESEIAGQESELEDIESSPASYEIVTYPTDFTLEGLFQKWKKKQIDIPGFQRKYIWTLPQASKLIESFLLGLPVPALFLYTDPDTGNLQVVDGQQRLTSVVQFFGGKFSNAKNATERVFRLTSLAPESPFAGATYDSLKDQLPAFAAKFEDAVMRAFVIKQLDPSDSTSIYHIFERLNTGGSTLMGQEIRNCVYHGKLNTLLCELNELPPWREIYGKQPIDGRMRDVELILRCISLSLRLDEYQKPMKDFLSTSMRTYRNPTITIIETIKQQFTKFCDRVLQAVGARPFHNQGRLITSRLDAAYTALHDLDQYPDDLKSRLDSLFSNLDFTSSSTFRTTDKDEVAKRIRIARERLR